MIKTAKECGFVHKKLGESVKINVVPLRSQSSESPWIEKYPATNIAHQMAFFELGVFIKEYCGGDESSKLADHCRGQT